MNAPAVIRATESLARVNHELARTLESPLLYALEQAGEIATEVLDERVTTWAEEGWTQRQMADEIGCAPSSVSDRLKRLGVKTKDRRGGARDFARLPSKTGKDEPEVWTEEDKQRMLRVPGVHEGLPTDLVEKAHRIKHGKSEPVEPEDVEDVEVSDADVEIIEPDAVPLPRFKLPVDIVQRPGVPRVEVLRSAVEKLDEVEEDLEVVRSRYHFGVSGDDDETPVLLSKLTARRDSLTRTIRVLRRQR